MFSFCILWKVRGVMLDYVVIDNDVESESPFILVDKNIGKVIKSHTSTDSEMISSYSDNYHLPDTYTDHNQTNFLQSLMMGFELDSRFLLEFKKYNFD
jgi:hypothetical protein